MPTRALATRLVALTLLCVVALAALGCDESVATDDLPTPSPAATQDTTATPPSASQIAQDNLLGLWRRREAPLDPTVQDAVIAACRAAPVTGFGGGDGPGDLPVAVVDSRGAGRVTVVFADDTRWSACLATVDEALAVTVTAAGQPGDAVVTPVGENEIAISALEVLDDLPSAQRSVLIGRVGKNAFKVTSGFDDQTYVDGPHDHGWYTMWWPGNVVPAAVAAEDMRNTAIGAVTPKR